MSFASDQGYVPQTIADLMGLVRQGVNTVFGTTYTDETFLGTNFYKTFYALVQRLQENEVRTSEITSRIQQYFKTTNELITRPNTTNPGIVDFFASKGFRASVKKPIDADAGKVYIAVDTDSAAPTYPATKLLLGLYVSQCAVAGAISQGTEVVSVTLSNLQAFDFKYNLPTKTAILVRVTIVVSGNNQGVVPTIAQIQAIVFANVSARYRLGLNFEPQRYYGLAEAPFASSVLVEYSTNGGSSWSSSVAALAYDQLYTVTLAGISVVFA